MGQADMKKFKDSEGRTWKLVITFGQLKKVKKELDVNLGVLLNDGYEKFNELLMDPMQFIPVLFVLLEKQIDDANITEDDFGEALFGDGLGNAQQAFIEAYSDFCPSRQKKMLRLLVAKTNEMQDLLLDKIENTDMTSFESVMNTQQSQEPELVQKTFPFAS